MKQTKVASSGTPAVVWVPALVFTAVCLLFLFVAFFTRPNLTAGQEGILNFIFAITAGFSTSFLGGTAFIQITGDVRGFKLLFSATSGIAVFVFCFLHPIFHDHQNGGGISPAEREALRLEDDIMSVRGSWENSDNSPADRDRVAREAPGLGDAMLLLQDRELRPAYQIVKYEYAQYAFMMAAAVHPHGDDSARRTKMQYIEKCLDNAHRGLEIIQEVRRNYVANEDHRKAVEFIRHEFDEERIKYHYAICLCRQHDVQRDEQLKKQASELVVTIEKTSPAFLKEYPVDTNAEFKGCVSLAK